MAETAGYTGKPLYRKLEFKPGMRVLVVNRPAHYSDLLAGAEAVTFLDDPGPGVDAVHLFLHDTGALAEIPRCLDLLAPGGRFWISWAKKSSPLHTGITEDMLRAAVLPLGWVDTKVCAVDADWSGLKFLKRRV